MNGTYRVDLRVKFMLGPIPLGTRQFGPFVGPVPFPVPVEHQVCRIEERGFTLNVRLRPGVLQG